jgi:hypothetical protein
MDLDYINLEKISWYYVCCFPMKNTAFEEKNRISFLIDRGLIFQQLDAAIMFQSKRKKPECAMDIMKKHLFCIAELFILCSEEISHEYYNK